MKCPIMFSYTFIKIISFTFSAYENLQFTFTYLAWLFQIPTVFIWPVFFACRLLFSCWGSDRDGCIYALVIRPLLTYRRADKDVSICWCLSLWDCAALKDKDIFISRPTADPGEVGIYHTEAVSIPSQFSYNKLVTWEPRVMLSYSRVHEHIIIFSRDIYFLHGSSTWLAKVKHLYLHF